MAEALDFTTANLQGQQVAFLKSGTIIANRYVIERVLGSGGMGSVYLAIDRGFPGGRPCAIKETPTPADDPPTPQQMIRMNALREEADIMSKLHHASIPVVYDYFHWQRRHYLVMEHIEGETLNDKLKRKLVETRAGFDEPAVIEWGILICNLFDYLHNQNPPVIHRDCKPDNFIITPDNQLKMIDYGIARRLIYEGDTLNPITALGAQGYAAPESYQRYGDQRTDLYSLGAMMHALLTGHDPQLVPLFEWEKFRPRRFRPTLTKEFEDIIMSCLQHDMNRRWPSAKELRHALITLREYFRRAPNTEGPAFIGIPATGMPSTVKHESGTLSHTDKTITHWRALAPKIAWIFEAKGVVRSSPRLYKDSIYFGAHDSTMYRLNVHDGVLQGSLAVNGNICSDPAITEKSIFFGTEDGWMYAVDHALTRKQWNYATGKAILSSPTVIDDLVVIGSNNHLIYGFPQAGGEPRWKFETAGEVRSSFATINDLIICGSHDQRIYALDVKGHKKWWRTTRDKVEALPVAMDNVIIIGSVDQYLYALDSELGEPIWRQRLDGCILTGAAVNENRIFVGSADGVITCLDARTGVEKWRYNVGSQITTDLVLRDQRVYFGCADGGMYCLDTKRKEIIWRHQAGGSIVTRPLLVNNLVIIGSLDHRVYALYDGPTASHKEA